MKVLILCGGLGTRLAEETVSKPKPMVKIGQKPILWHLIKFFYTYGLNDFILATGYKSNIIKNYFKNNPIKNCKIKVCFTGKNTLTGGRILRLKKLMGNDDFIATYGDGVSDVNIDKLINFHKRHKGVVTLTAVRPPVRFGEIKISANNKVSNFKEKPQASQNWINGGFFIMRKEVFKFIKDDNSILEKKPFEKLTKNKKLYAYKHYKFWQCMDTLREKKYLNKIWSNGNAPWKKW
tara:strand:+ start:2223 stop:2930 length:708 start_codon:yes stop_codon:yes gene_type:complete